MDTCPLCHGLSFDGTPCQPECDPGALHANHVEFFDDSGSVGGSAAVGTDGENPKRIRKLPNISEQF